MGDIYLLATVLVFVFDTEGRLLSIKEKREDSKIWYNLPGGTLEKFETLEDCVVREVLEETGYKIKNVEFVGNVQNIWKDGYSSMKLIYKALLDEKEQVAQTLDETEDVESIEWLSRAEAKEKSEKFWKETAQIASHFFNNDNFGNLTIKR